MAKVSSVRFIRCKKCGHKTRDIFHVCPNCGSNLESVSFPYLTWGMIIILAGIGFFAYQSYIPNIEQTVEQIEHTSKQVVSMVDPATETPTPTLTHTSTLAPQTSSSPIPSSTSTDMPTNTPTSTETLSPMPTDIPTDIPTNIPTNIPTDIPTNIPTDIPTPTKIALLPTFTPPPTFTPTPFPTSTPTVIPTPALRFEKPVLTKRDSPHYATEEIINLEWHVEGALASDEWYAVRLSWMENGETSFGGANVKEPAWIVPRDYYGKADQSTGRAYHWHVHVENNEGVQISPSSETLTFYWE